MPVESKYNVSSNNLSGERLLFNTLTRHLIRVSEDVYDEIKAGIDCRRKLTKLGFIAPVGTNEFELARDLNQRMRLALKERLSITVVPSLKCNFSCNYCYNGIHHNEKYNEVAVENSIRYVEDELKYKEPLHVTWYGGEPTFFIKQIESATSRFEEICAARGASYTSDIFTNGSIITRRIGRQLARAKIKRVQVSVDWPLKTAQRAAPGGGVRESLIKILDNINNVPARVGVTIRVNTMPDFLATFPRFLSLTRTHISRSIGMYLHRVDESNDWVLNTPESQRFHYEDTVKYYQDYLKAKRLIRQIGIQQAYYPGDAETGICTAQTRRDLIFTPDGRVKKCVREVYGPAAESSDWNRKRASLPILNVNSIEREEFYMEHAVPSDSICGRCSFLPICQGGCVKEVYEKPDDVMRRCTPWKFTLEEELDYLLKEMQREERRCVHVTHKQPAERRRSKPSHQAPGSV